MTLGSDTLKTRRTLTVGDEAYNYYSLEAAGERIGDVSRLPFSFKVLLKNLLHYEDGKTVTVEDIEAMAGWLAERRSSREITYSDSRTLT